MLVTKLFTKIFKSNFLTAGLLLGTIVLTGGCTSSTTNTSSTNSEQTATASNKNVSETQVLTDFVDNVVMPTYSLLVDRSGTLNTAIETFVAKPTEENLKAAQTAWMEARTPWEQSETFAFGPASSGYDGELDDWPVNQVDVAKVVKSNEKITSDFVAKTLQTTEKGFHTIEYLLFGENNDRKATELTPRELELLKQLSVYFNDTAIELKASWETGVDGKPAYKETFTTAGSSNNTTYPTVKAALQEILAGMVESVEEVGEAKMGEPLTKKDSFYFESRFSHSTINDFKNNVQSAMNGYEGKFPLANTKSSASLSDLVAKNDPALDKEIKASLQECMDLLNAIPTPVETKLKDPDAVAKMEAAQEKLLTTYRNIKSKVSPMFKEG
jgi:putative iron-regulated protein